MTNHLTQDDVAACAAMHTHAFPHNPWNEQAIGFYVDDPTVLSMGTADTGFILVQTTPPEGELLTIVTHPDHQRKGHAQALMTEAMQVLRKDGVNKLFLDVAADNTPAVGLYEKFGAKTISTRQGYYAREGERQDALVMRIDI